jgi:hypothetical protein
MAVRRSHRQPPSNGPRDPMPYIVVFECLLILLVVLLRLGT